MRRPESRPEPKRERAQTITPAICQARLRAERRGLDTSKFPPRVRAMRGGGARGHFFQTYTGRKFYPMVPRPEDVDILDIAHSLSQICRFTGHTREFYSVAQHSLIVCDLVPDVFKFTALMHDAPEAYVGDMSKPLKRQLPSFVSAENRVWKAICGKWPALLLSLPLEVKQADVTALATERRDVLANGYANAWLSVDTVTPAVFRIQPMPPKNAERLFLKRFRELCG